MNTLDSFNAQILNIYNNNFPPYLKISNKLFKKDIKKYKYWDLWIDDGTKQFNTNNIKKNEGLNKQQTYLHPISSANQNSINLMGFAFLNYFPAMKLLHLDYISLDKKYQGKGNGTKYLNHIINTFYKANKKIDYMVLECEDHLINFYEKNNFFKLNFNYSYFDVKLNLMIYNDFDNYHMIYKCANFLANLFRCFNKFQIISILVHYYDDWLYYRKIFREGYKYHIIDNFKKK
jgi:ribosomal protein S18 acetylase RimI-like enzyme